MYGTIARLRIKPGKEQELKTLGREFMEGSGIPGLVFEYIYKLDSGGDEYMMVVGFTDRAAYRANGDSPEQAARYERFRALLAAEPEWYDGEIVDSYPS